MESSSDPYFTIFNLKLVPISEASCTLYTLPVQLYRPLPWNLAGFKIIRVGIFGFRIF
jgi:hypothetical protein